ncbi:hypothetical protein [uncultured Legionella sp.]|uniref:hypothetical protein n=1 Tax=uncultured Legionella sp. TaxID=210934 RepID=UPI0026331529|nr:hypothetical protein [uncultured Legionella sp.]
MDPRLRLSTVPELPGLIAINTPTEPTQFHILDPSLNDSEARMMLVIPQLEGRDLDDLVFKHYLGEEWPRFGSYMHRLLASVPVLPQDKTETMTIGPKGYAEWSAVAQGNKSVHLVITTNNSWHLYDSTFKSLAKGKGNSQLVLPSGEGLAYLTLFGTPGQKITVSLRSDERK